MLLLTYLEFREVTRDKNRTGFYPCITVHVLFGNSTVFSTVCFLDVCSINNTLQLHMNFPSNMPTLVVSLAQSASRVE